MNVETKQRPYKGLKAERKEMNMDRYVQGLHSKFGIHGEIWMEIWTGANYKGYNLLVVSGEDAWLISTDKKITSNDLPIRFSRSGANYSF
ncbi:hypothetical protein [Bacillus cereus]|uniref:hypothetical protein n=1 Tax=Bacillus cereus TaxID=1396 RepID=UPI000BF6939A|nr:hypothetical protein [Bacillus cereus]PFA91065.1 hypothetical protein CN393_07915 [Bacillus cereus]